MSEEKQMLLQEQINKIEDVIATLNQRFQGEDLDDETNFLTIVRDNHKEIK
ncbi:hypothetical protein [Hoylesella shahii]|jgi:hypothetical protein|uniref:hypothetical protein n=1 Tax=Hoylesella shahii TaxID=228603 RepID=UPI001CAF8672|nr:hypothetical protein [Hoylesella shahii]MBF1577248.1 hypothetical protein [Hoylesella shahii]